MIIFYVKILNVSPRELQSLTLILKTFEIGKQEKIVRQLQRFLKFKQLKLAAKQKMCYCVASLEVINEGFKMFISSH